ncbi:uncharacterized protein LOC143186487 [Calliopsis andreniformis]|uniref:uncharacterized protein LOC143186487 n=1 Tax=Calliopsis andreniformis TaxID=337506 RepID=UPI003FCDA263
MDIDNNNDDHMLDEIEFLETEFKLPPSMQSQPQSQSQSQAQSQPQPQSQPQSHPQPQPQSHPQPQPESETNSGQENQPPRRWRRAGWRVREERRRWMVLQVLWDQSHILLQMTALERWIRGGGGGGGGIYYK